MNRDEVVRLLTTAGLNIVHERRMPNDKGVRIECSGGEIVNVYDTGAIVPQGANVSAISAILGLPGPRPVTAPAPIRPAQQKVFVVYGHSRELRDELELTLRRWDLNPLILEALPSEGATVIEKLEKYATSDVDFAIVLATPDDVGSEKGHEAGLRPRARQNVVLELGMLLAKVGRKKVAILLQTVENMEPPSDIAGLIYVQFHSSISEAKAALAREMASAGVRIDLSKL